MDNLEKITAFQRLLLALPDVTSKAEFGNETFLVGGARFAAVTARGLVMRLPSADLLAVLKAGIARPFVSMGAMGRHGWVEVHLPRVNAEVLEALAVCAHSAARHSHRRSAPRKPTGARRTRHPLPKKRDVT